MTRIIVRWFNLLKIVCSYLFSLATRSACHWGKPLAVSIEPNNTCNLACPECPTGTHELTRTTGMLKPDQFKHIIDQLVPELFWLTLYFQGEPFLNRHFFDFVAYARSKNIFVATSTNGHFLNNETVRKTIDSGLNRLIISLDGDNQESYSVYRKGGHFETVLDGIRKLVQEKERRKSRYPKIILQTLLLSSTENRLGNIKALAKSLGVDKLELKTAQFNDYQNGNPLMPTSQKHSRYKITKSPTQHIGTLTNQHITSLYTVKNPLPNSCFRMWSSCVITWDGKVVPCCFDKDATHTMGDLIKQDFKQIWRSKPYHDFRKKILTNRKSIDICQNCNQTF